MITKIKNFFTDFKTNIPKLKKYFLELLPRINPKPADGQNFILDYLIRLLIFLFPLYIYDNTVVLGLSFKDVLSGILVLVMVLWCINRVIMDKLVRIVKANKGNMIMIASFLLLLIVLAVQLFTTSAELPHTYLYIGCFLLTFCVFFLGRGTKYYLQLGVAATGILYLSLFRYIFTGITTILASENLATKPTYLMPLLLLGIGSSSILYILESDKRMEKVYLVHAAAGLVIMFLYGDMVGYALMLLFIMSIQFISRPTIPFMKKNMILLFLFGFCASNAPLLTYFNAAGVTKTFDLEYSIYIDIVIAVLGLLVTNYWEKIPKDYDANRVLMKRFSKWYRVGMIIVLMILAIAFVFGSRGASLGDALGGKALKGLATSFWKSISKSNGELWHVLDVYGVVGIAAMILLGMVLVNRIVLAWKHDGLDELDKGYVLIATLFIIQSLFYPYSAASTPIFMIFTAFGIYRDRHALEIEPVENDVEPEKEEEVDKKRLLSFHELLHKGVLIIASATAASLIVLVVIGVHGLIVPYKKNTEIGSIYKVAKEQHAAQQLLLAENGAATGEVASEEASDESGEGDAITENTTDVAQTVPATDSALSSLFGMDDDGDDLMDDALDNPDENAESNGDVPAEDEIDAIPAGVSGGDYRVYDPNANYETVDQTVIGTTDQINLRAEPSMGDNVEIVHRLTQGETAKRTGIGENGWSRLEFDGRIVYAVSSYVKEVTQEELEAMEAEQAEAAAQEQAQQEEALREQEAQAQAEAEKEKQAQEAKNAKPTGPVSYSMQWGADNKSCSLWSAGKLQGTLTVTDGTGANKSMTYYGTYYQGSGKDQKQYFYISVPQGDTELVINADDGFVQAIKNMGYSGLYFNKQIHNW
ncbi:SH3 domain-containing protein [Butyrivibrio sp. YAB3001]|uniref:SH3 domain-containing protein n=1 Tax=Butyrivibrio sp. YAB3001 TaxID=1520812 RepID=UPI000B89D1E6|nr:SH3 domain-containing protein [Butyrivibrio sp. YAB3001]